MKNIDNIKIAFGNRLRQIREAQKVTQEDLADMLKTDTRQIGRIENGEIFTTLKTVARLAIALEVPVIEFFRYEE